MIDDRLIGLYKSNKIEDIRSFYQNFETESELIHWMQGLSKPKPKIKIIESKNSDIAVIVPTADANGRLADNIKRIFKGFLICFVEDISLTFRLSYSYNYGLKAVKAFDFSWVIFTNDDMIEVDPADRLRQEIYKKKDAKIMFARSTLTSSHSNVWEIGHYTKMGKFTHFIMNHEFAMLEKKYNINVSIREKCQTSFPAKL